MKVIEAITITPANSAWEPYANLAYQKVLVTYSEIDDSYHIVVNDVNGSLIMGPKINEIIILPNSDIIIPRFHTATFYSALENIVASCYQTGIKNFS